MIILELHFHDHCSYPSLRYCGSIQLSYCVVSRVTFNDHYNNHIIYVEPVSLVPCYPHLASLYIASSPSCVSKLSYSASVAVFSTVDVVFAFLYFLACCLLLWFRLLPLFEHSFYWPLSPSALGCSSRYPVFASKLATRWKPHIVW